MTEHAMCLDMGGGRKNYLFIWILGSKIKTVGLLFGAMHDTAKAPWSHPDHSKPLRYKVSIGARES